MSIRSQRDTFTGPGPAWSNERGSVVLFVALAMVLLLGMSGLAVDMGRAYLSRARMVRAVDAAALAGARVFRSGQGQARQHALAIAQANGLGNGNQGPNLSVQFGQNQFGENTVQVTASETMPTLLARVLGRTTVDIRARAEAATPPVDLILVIDHSGSLQQAGAWGDLQDAARSFVQKFDDNIDQMGLVGFNTRATQRVWLTDHFTGSITSTINTMTSAGWTNTGQSLKYAYDQLTGGAVRQRSVKVVVFFTDGRPTAFRDVIGLPGSEQDRVMAVGETGSNVVGYWDDPLNTLPNQGNPPSVDGCANSSNCFGYWNGDLARTKAHDDGRTWASAIRGDGAYIYTIGLGWAVESYLDELSNEGGISDPGQPRGRTYVAPTAADLDAVFDLVASDIFVRLAS
ncbi:MAG: VWA domain-containing protein [Gemmatimonadota bacterium]